VRGQENSNRSPDWAKIARAGWAKCLMAALSVRRSKEIDLPIVGRATDCPTL
jgi:hypothetical protein